MLCARVGTDARRSCVEERCVFAWRRRRRSVQGPAGSVHCRRAPAAPLIAYLSCNVVPDMTISSSARGLVLCGLLAAAGTVLAQSATTTRSSNTLQPITTPTPVQPTVAPPRPVQPTPTMTPVPSQLGQRLTPRPSRPADRHRRRWPRPAARCRPARRWSTTATGACCKACSRPAPTACWTPRPAATTTQYQPAMACAWCAEGAVRATAC